MTQQQFIYVRNVYVYSAGRCERYLTDLSGHFDANGDFIDRWGHWIARKSDNAQHPAFQ